MESWSGGIEGTPAAKKPPLDPIPGSIDGYRVDGVLGRGSTGIVLRVHDEALDRPMALKLLADDLDDDARARFLIEARAAARLIHPNVVQVFAVGSYEGRTYIVQELVDGHALSSLLEARGKLRPASVIDIGIQVSRGLERAAEAGIVHRDVKPQNLLVTDEGLVKLADFGLAKMMHAPTPLTENGIVVGTPHYMSPEQGMAEALDARSDQYSLGATLYHLLTGRAPFDSDNAVALLLMHVQEPLVSVRSLSEECPPRLAEAIEKMLAKKPEDRFDSFAEVIEALETAEDVEEALDDPVPAPRSSRSRFKEAAVILGVLLIAGAVIFVAGFTEAKKKKTVSPPVVELLPQLAPRPVRKSITSEKPMIAVVIAEKNKTEKAPSARFERLLSQLQDTKHSERAARELGELGDQRATPALIALLEGTGSAKARAAAAEALGRLGDTRAIVPLQEALDRANPELVQNAARAAQKRLFHVVDEPAAGDSDHSD